MGYLWGRCSRSSRDLLYTAFSVISHTDTCTYLTYLNVCVQGVQFVRKGVYATNTTCMRRCRIVRN